jgi:hypothetical protein
MRGLSIAVVAAAALAPAAQAGLWTASCTDRDGVQYVQTIGGDGYLHYGRGDGTFTTVKLKQSFYDGKVVCGSVPAKPAPGEIAAICADEEKQTIRVETGAYLAKGVEPEAAPVYCPAVVSAN